MPRWAADLPGGTNPHGSPLGFPASAGKPSCGRPRPPAAGLFRGRGCRPPSSLALLAPLDPLGSLRTRGDAAPLGTPSASLPDYGETGSGRVQPRSGVVPVRRGRHADQPARRGRPGRRGGRGTGGDDAARPRSAGSARHSATRTGRSHAGGPSTAKNPVTFRYGCWTSRGTPSTGPTTTWRTPSCGSSSTCCSTPRTSPSSAASSAGTGWPTWPTTRLSPTRWPTRRRPPRPQPASAR